MKQGASGPEAAGKTIRGQGSDGPVEVTEVLGVPRRSILLGAALCALSSAGLAVAGDGRLELALGGPTSSPQARRAADPGCVNHVSTSRPLVALTFDDGPDPDFTPAVLDLLRRFGARATFFVVGANALAHPELVERIRREGHLLANHTHDHAHLCEIRGVEVRDQVARCRRVIGPAPAPAMLLRPPVGHTSPLVARVVRGLGEREVFWSACLEASIHEGAASGGRALGERLGPGAIVLAHDGGRVAGRWAQTYDRSQTVVALPHLLESLAARGLRSVPVPELVAAGRVR